MAWSLLGSVVAALDGPAAVADVGLPTLARAMAAIAELIEDRSLQGCGTTRRPGRSARSYRSSSEHGFSSSTG